MSGGRAWLGALGAVAALACTGCQGQVTQGTTEHVRATAQAFLDACSHGDVVSAMDVLTPEARRVFVHQGSGLDACVAFLGLAKPGETLTPGERLDRVQQARIGPISNTYGDQFTTVTVLGPSGARQPLEVEQRGTLWELDNTRLAERTSTPEAAGEHAVDELLDACAHEDGASAEAVLTPKEVPGFRADVLRADTSTACLKLLDLEVAGRRLSTSDRDDLLERTEVSDVETVAPDRASVTVQAPDGRERELDARAHGATWLVEPA